MSPKLFSQYNRSGVHELFQPESNWIQGHNIWSLMSIIKVPNREKDFLFYVTLDQSQEDHLFNEGLSKDGILSWNSHRKMDLNHQKIHEFIHHNHLTDNIHLFLRTRKLNINSGKTEPYTYLGRLAYITHDKEKEKPVHFKWQLLDWGFNQDVFDRIGLQIDFPSESNTPNLSNQLLFTDPPAPSEEERGILTKEFRGFKVDFAEIEEKNRHIGQLGELLVLEYERQQLIADGRADLAQYINHVSQTIGDGTGYDILSFTLDGKEKYIEVKTTSGDKRTPFYISSNEVTFSEQYRDQYYLYRVYDYNMENNSGEVYLIQGSVSENLRIEPILFKASR